jgi:hypothetical protein
MFLYKISVVHKLSNYDKERQLQFTDWAEGKDEILFNKWFLDKACFYLDGIVKNRTRTFGGQDLLRTPTKTALTEDRSPFGLPSLTMA